MSINPAMLALSAANPALLPLALGMSSSRYPMGGTVRHEHKVEHSVKPGTGQELRGISVDPQRGAKAFAAALQAIESIKVEYAGKIEEGKKKAEEENAKLRQREDEEWRKYEQAVKEREAAEDEVRRLEALSESKFWGLSAEENVQLREAKAIVRQGLFARFPHKFFDRRIQSASEKIDEVHGRIKEQYVLCSVALYCTHLDPVWAKAIFYIEEDPHAWLSQFYVFKELLS